METARNQRSPEPVSTGKPPVEVAPAPANTTAPPRRARRPFVILGIVAVLVLGGITVYRMMTAGRENTDDAQVTADMVPVGTRVAGAVAHVAVTENQLVKKDQLLVEIDRADYAARVQQAEAELATAKAQATAAEAQVQIVEATSKGGFASAQAALDRIDPRRRRRRGAAARQRARRSRARSPTRTRPRSISRARRS